ncbi:MAG: glycosyltransferase [Hymenobacter sp.]|nr:MAG: glycosyltransferase [Hymenobacter sp.]
MKILFLSYAFAPAIGGIEASSELLADALVGKGHTVRLLTMTTSENEREAWLYEVIRCPSSAELLKQHAWADIVYENNPSLRLGWPKLLFSRPSVITLHTWVSRIDGSIGVLDKLKFRWLAQANQVIAVSTALQQRCAPQAVVIGNSYNDKLFSFRPVVRHPDFVFLGRLVSDKGVELAIRAFSAIVTAAPELAAPDATLTIIGSGPDREHLERMAAQLPGGSRIQFSGPLKGEGLVMELNRHTFQFIPSAWEEPFGIVALEGIACGLLPIASDGGGLPEAIGQAGVTFRRGQLASLIEVTTELLGNPARQAQCRAAAPAHLAAFGAEVITHQFMAVLEAAAQSSASVN